MKRVFLYFILFLFVSCVQDTSLLTTLLKGSWKNANKEGELIITFQGDEFTWEQDGKEKRSGVYSIRTNSELIPVEERALLTFNFGEEYENVAKVENFYLSFKDNTYKVLQLKAQSVIGVEYSEFSKVEGK